MANTQPLTNGEFKLCLDSGAYGPLHQDETDLGEQNGIIDGDGEAKDQDTRTLGHDELLRQLSPPPLNPTTPLLQLLNGNGLKIPPNGENKVDSGNLHVLLVDDNKINLQLLVMFMRKCGFSYEEAMNGQEALDKFKDACLPGPRTTSDGASQHFDFVLMDISMPVMNGIEATRRIRDFERENNLPGTNVIALTGLASRDAQRDAKSAGIDIFLPKPVRFAELKELLTAAKRG